VTCGGRALCCRRGYIREVEVDLGRAQPSE